MHNQIQRNRSVLLYFFQQAPGFPFHRFGSKHGLSLIHIFHLKQRYEIRGIDHALFRMNPAYQCLGAFRPVSLQPCLLYTSDYQGHGYGHIVLPMMIEKLRSEYHRKKIYLSVVEENQGAIHLYEKFGFQFNGETDVHGEKVMVLKETLKETLNRSAERNLN